MDVKVQNDKINKIILFLKEHKSLRKWKKHFNIISTQIYFTANGIKLGYLWDAGTQINPTILSKVLITLVKLELIPDTLKIFECCTELFIINLNKLNKLLENNQLINIPLIDVTKTLSTPQLLIRKDEVIFKIGALIKCIADANLVGKFPTFICVPTVIGILIGYPVVYWYNSEISDENNLINSRLTVFQLTHNGLIVYSFSVPYDILNQSVVLKESIKSWLDDKAQHGFETKTFVTETGYVVM